MHYSFRGLSISDFAPLHHSLWGLSISAYRGFGQAFPTGSEYRGFGQPTAPKGGATHGVIFTFKRNFSLSPVRFFTEPCSHRACRRHHGRRRPCGRRFPKGAVLALTAASAPGECLSVARYRFLHHIAVSFVSSDVRVFEHASGSERRAIRHKTLANISVGSS